MTENGQILPPSKLWTFSFLAAISLRRVLVLMVENQRNLCHFLYLNIAFSNHLK